MQDDQPKQTEADATLFALESAVLRSAGITIEQADVRVNGVRWHYLTCGSGEPLVLLHGRGMAAGVFAPILRLLASEHKVFAVDLPGWGLSAKPPLDPPTAEAAMHQWADAVTQFLDAMNLPEVDILGHSLGGLIALYCAQLHPQRIRRIIVVDGAGTGTLMQWDVRLYFGLGPERLHRLLGPRFTEFVLRHEVGTRHDGSLTPDMLKFCHAVLSQSAVVSSGASAFSKYVNLRGVHFNLRTQLREIAQPVLLIWGEHDMVTPLRDGILASRYLPDAQLVTMTHCGHVPFFERPDDLAEVVLAWLKNYFVRSRI